MNEQRRDTRRADAPISFRSKRLAIRSAFILPKELMARLKLQEGDKFHIVEQTERGIQA